MSTKDIVTAYIQAIEAHRLDEVASYLHPEVTLLEHPNKLNPNGKIYDLAEIKAAGERGAKLLATESYKIRSMVVEGVRAAVLLEWTGTLGIAAGPMPAGHVMRGQFCSVIELREGKVWRQEQYDCFLP